MGGAQSRLLHALPRKELKIQRVHSNVPCSSQSSWQWSTSRHPRSGSPQTQSLPARGSISSHGQSSQHTPLSRTSTTCHVRRRLYDGLPCSWTTQQNAGALTWSTACGRRLHRSPWAPSTPGPAAQASLAHRIAGTTKSQTTKLAHHPAAATGLPRRCRLQTSMNFGSETRKTADNSDQHKGRQALTEPEASTTSVQPP